MDTTNRLIIDEAKVKTVISNCLLCKSSNSSTIIKTGNIRRGTQKEYEVVQCEDCGYHYVKNPPDDNSLKLYYPEDYYSLVPQELNLLDKVYYSVFRRVPSKKKGAILDIGCGNGIIVELLRQNGFDNVYGVDITLEGLKQHTPNIKFNQPIPEFKPNIANYFEFPIWTIQ